MTDPDAPPVAVPPARPAGRAVDLRVLKALSHPVRLAVFDRLSVTGCETASSLADFLGESSGVTSYHLRQLARHGLVREVEDRGTARERWWERVPGAITLDVTELKDDPAAYLAATALVDHWEAEREHEFGEFLRRGSAELGDDWFVAAMMQTANLRLDRTQLAEFTTALGGLVNDLLDRYRGEAAPGARPVQLQINAFPLMDGAAR